MRLASALPLVLTLAIPSLAAARPITAGINLGVAQSKLDGEAGADANRTLGLFGRLGFNERLSGQLEVLRIQTDDESVDIRSATALLVIDLGARGRLVPILVAGLGLDRASTSYGSTTDAHHIEGGLGLEFRGEGFTLGAELRMGGRSLDQSSDDVYPLATDGVGIAYYVPSTLSEGEYRSGRITLGLQF